MSDLLSRRVRTSVIVVAAGGILLLGVGAAAMLKAEPGAGGVASRADDRWMVLEVGSFDLPAGSSHHEVEQPEMRAVTFARTGFVHGFDVEMLDAEGGAVSPRVLHHVNLIIPHERELFSEIMLRLGAAGPETGRVMLPRVLGYPVSAGDSLIITAMFHNPESTSYRGVRMRVHLRFTPGDRWPRPLAVRPFYLDVMPPDSRHSFDLPPGRTTMSWEGSPAVGGRLLGLGGHLHKHGTLLRLEDVTAGRTLWEAHPRLGADGEVVEMPVRRFFHRLGLPMHADRVYRLTAIYENDSGETIAEGGMGALGGVFLPARGTTWPAANRAHPQYRRDRELVADSHGAGAHGHEPRSDGHHGGAVHHH